MKIHPEGCKYPRHFKVGDRVILMRHSPDHAMFKRLGTVAGIDTNSRVWIDTPRIRVHFDGVSYRSDFAWHAWRFDYVHKLDLSRVRHTRDGRPVQPYASGDAARPFAATIEIDGRQLELSFDPQGHFYSNFDLPCDLVEAP